MDRSPMCLSIRLFLCLPLSFSVSFYLAISLFVCLSVCLCLCLSVYFYLTVSLYRMSVSFYLTVSLYRLSACNTHTTHTHELTLQSCINCKGRFALPSSSEYRQILTASPVSFFKCSLFLPCFFSALDFFIFFYIFLFFLI